jgi:ABC-type antimicrobial peptide transport system permease subunit
VATAVLVGALVVGDSVRYSLREMALSRIGRTEIAMASGDRFFRASLADRVAKELGAPAAAVLQLRGTAVREDGEARINEVQVLGVDEAFWAMASAKPPLPAGARNAVAINEQVARRLELKVGDGLVLRFQKPTALPLDVPLAGEDASVGAHLTVGAIISDAQFGRFSLAANQAPPANVFVPRDWLEQQVNQAGRANLLLVSDDQTHRRAGSEQAPDAAAPPLAAAAADAVLARDAWSIDDAELELRPLPAQNAVELRSRRIFIDRAVSQTPSVRAPGNLGILTYFVNELRVSDRAAPYSVVSALGPIASGEGTAALPLQTLTAGMADDEIVINAWLAEDLAAKPGDTLEMAYYAMAPGGRLETRSAKFRVRAVVPLDGPVADRDLMPDFPGLSDVENCRDWKPGIPISSRKIRPKDEEYWKRYRGTPKAFITLAAGQKMWANRFGDLTAMRFPASDSPARAQALAESLRHEINPASLGLYFQDVRGRALAASSSAVDFGQLFLGLSMFLVAAALILTGLLFGLTIGARAEETGTLLALGLAPKYVRRLYLAEGAILALAGGALGTLAGLAYTWVMLLALSTVWSSAVGSSNVLFHAQALSVIGGAAAGFVVALATIWLCVRRQARAPARELLASGAEAELRLTLPRRARTWIGWSMTAASGVVAGLLLSLAKGATGEAAAGVFFGIGALLLIGLLGACHSGLAGLAQPPRGGQVRFADLGLRNAARRRGRSLGVIAILACGIFMVVAVGANRRGAEEDADKPSSGTGGFALYGETAMPVFKDLNSPEGRKAYALPDDFQHNAAFVALRVHAGDDASCLNLNRTQQPRLVGVRPQLLAQRGAFTLTAQEAADAGQSPWLLLDRREADGAIPAIADTNTITWSLGKKLGDTVAYTDERGRTFQVRLVAAIDNSILQGSLVIAEDALIEKYPSDGGYRMFLIDASRDRAEEIARVLSVQLSDVGLAVMPATERLAEFNSVENTYLAIFQALGGLGLILGSVGLGVIVFRNVMERRSELALMRAVGFSRRSIARLILTEHWVLLALGLVVGWLAAIVAVLPAMRAGPVPYLSLGITAAAVLAAGLLWTWLAARLALRGPLLEALRNE